MNCFYKEYRKRNRKVRTLMESCCTKTKRDELCLQRGALRHRRNAALFRLEARNAAKTALQERRSAAVMKRSAVKASRWILFPFISINIPIFQRIYRFPLSLNHTNFLLIPIHQFSLQNKIFYPLVKLAITLPLLFKND